MIDEAIILAGGRGTRLQSAVADVPKPMAPISGRPFLEFLLDQLIRHGVRRVILSVGYRREVIQAHFGPSYRGLAIRYCIEKEPLGTGGALAAALQGVAGTSAIVLNGDSFLAVDLGALAARDLPGRLTMTVCAIKDAERFGTCVIEDGTVCSFLSKGQEGPAWINGGVYLAPKVLFAGHAMPAVFSFEDDFLKPKVAALRPQAHFCEAPFIDIGVPASYASAEAFFAGLSMTECP